MKDGKDFGRISRELLHVHKSLQQIIRAITLMNGADTMTSGQIRIIIMIVLPFILRLQDKENAVGYITP